MILVITKEHDAHGVHMIELLRGRGQDACVLDYSTYPQNLGISFGVDGGKEKLLLRLSDGRLIKSEEVVSVLNRRQAEPKAPSGIRGQRIIDYIVRESRNLLDALPQMLNCFWLSKPDAVKIASRKPYQLMVAKQLGFKIPQTLVTNSPTEAKQFITSLQSDVACKTLWTPGITVERDGAEVGISLYTRRVKPVDAIKGLSNVRNCPMIFQEYVDKAFELRITVVGRRVFACAIHSQQSEKTREDWRRYDLENTPHGSHELPHEISHRCVALVDNLGLAFGCIDMIVTPTGEYVFLEINPNGQWLWIEHLTKLPISDAIADLLINPPANKVE